MLCATVVELPIKYYQLIGEMIIYLRLKWCLIPLKPYSTYQINIVKSLVDNINGVKLGLISGGAQVMR
jgi:hypothetical protein